MANASKAVYSGMALIWRLVRAANSPTEPKNIQWGDSVITGSANPDVNLFKPQTEARVAGTSTSQTTTQLGDTYQVIGTTTCLVAGKTITEAGLFDVTTSISPSTTTSASLTVGATSVTIASGTGLPGSGNYYAEITDTGSQSGTANNPEVVLVTAGQGTTTLTIVRGQLGSVANTHLTGAFFTLGGDGGTQASGGTTGQTVATATWQTSYGGNMYCHADFAGIALSVNDSINFTFKSQLTS